MEMSSFLSHPVDRLGKRQRQRLAELLVKYYIKKQQLQVMFMCKASK